MGPLVFIFVFSVLCGIERSSIFFICAYICFFFSISTATERAKLLRIYGPELFSEEARAVEGMFRMLNYQQSVDGSMLYPESAEDNHNHIHDDSNLDDTGISAQDFRNIMNESMNSQKNAKDDKAMEGKDILLPTFVRKALQEMLLASDAEGEGPWMCILCFFLVLCLHIHQQQLLYMQQKWFHL